MDDVSFTIAPGAPCAAVGLVGLYIIHDLLSARLVSDEIRGRPACESYE
jgi:hypothetical protein